MSDTASYSTPKASTSRDSDSSTIDFSLKNLHITVESMKRKATGNNDCNTDSKKQRFGSNDVHLQPDVQVPHNAEERKSCDEDPRSQDDNVDEIMEQEIPPFDGESGYAASGLKQTLHGNIYQLKLLMLFLKRGVRNDLAFRLATEMDAAEKFDDLIFQYEDKAVGGTTYRFLQAKHKQDDSKTIGAGDLLTERDDEFSLQKYFISYRNIKKHPELSKSTLKDFILCTNIDFDFEGLEAEQIHPQKILDPDALLDVGNSSKQTARYKLLVNERSQLYEILKRTSDAHVLAKTLAEHLFKKKKVSLRTDVLKLYHTALATEQVIDVEEKSFSENFRNGKNLSERGENFRNIFCSEFLKHMKLPETHASKKLMWTKIEGENLLQFSANFGKGLITDPVLVNPKKFSNEFVKLLENADNQNLVRVSKKNKIIADDIDKLAGHVLVAAEDKQIYKFRSQFLTASQTQPGNIDELKNVLKAQPGSTSNNMDRYRFKINNFPTYEEEQLHSKIELPEKDEVDGEEISEFFDKLVFAVNQPNEVELGAILTRELAADSQFNLHNANLTYDSLLNKMLDWFKGKGKEKGKEGVFLTNIDGKEFFKSIEGELNTILCSGLSLSYLAQIARYGIKFERENQEVRKFLKPDSDHGTGQQALNLIASEETFLTAIRVHQTIRNTRKYEKTDSLIFIRLHTLLLPGIERRVINAFETKDSHDLLVIDCESDDKRNLQELYDRLRKIMSNNNAKKLVLVTRGDKKSSSVEWKIDLEHCDNKSDEVGLNDLTEASRDKLLNHSIIIFQGSRDRLISFRELLGNRCCDDIVSKKSGYSQDLIDSSTLAKLIRGDKIEVGNGLQELGEITNFYIDRRVNKVFLKKDVFQSRPICDVLAIRGVDEDGLETLVGSEQHVHKRFVVLENGREREQFSTLCDSYSEFNVHWLVHESENFVWKQSRGNVTCLMDYRDTSQRESNGHDVAETTARYLTEDQLADHEEGNKVMIISDTAGMGKTTVLTSLGRKMKLNKSELWMIRVDLNDFTRVLKKEKEEKQERSRSCDESDLDRAVDFFVDELSNLGTDLEKKLLKIMIKNHGAVAVIFDGFDEISPDYEETVSELMQVLRHSSGVKKLIVSTRPHMSKYLEKRLGTFSHTMEPFSDDDQIDFLVRFWKMRLGRGSAELRIGRYAKALINKMHESMNDRNNEFAGIPLQTRMMAEVCLDNREERAGSFETCEEFSRSGNDVPRLPKILNIVDLYRSFIDKKYDIYITEKIKANPTIMGMKEFVETNRKTFLKTHQELALYTLFDPEDLDTLLPDWMEMECVNTWLSNVNSSNERTGFIIEVIDGKPQFIHRSFVEYFTATFLVDKLKHADREPEVKEFIVGQILLQPKYNVIRALLNGLLPERTLPANRRSKVRASAAGSWKSAIGDNRLESGKTIFHVAAEEDHVEIVRFILNPFLPLDETWKDLVNAEDSQSTSALIAAGFQENWETAKYLVEHCGISPNHTSSWITDKQTLLHVAAAQGDLDMVKWLVENGADLEIETESLDTPVFQAAAHEKLEVMKWLIDEAGVDVNMRNAIGRTALHITAMYDTLDIFKWLIEEKNVDVNTRDEYNLSALDVAVYERSWKVMKWFVEKNGAEYRFDDGSTMLEKLASRYKWEKARFIARLDTSDLNVVDKYGITKLRNDLKAGDSDAVKWLVENRVVVNVCLEDVDDATSYPRVEAEMLDVLQWLERSTGVKITGT